MSLVELFSSLRPRDSLPVLNHSIQAVDDLFAPHGWVPGEVTHSMLDKIVEVGYPLTYISCQSFDHVRRVIRDSFMFRDCIAQHILSELQAAALLKALGATDVKYINPQRGRRTPDLDVVWDCGLVTDFEVVSGLKKSAHIKVEKLAEHIVDAVGVPLDGHDIVIHCHDDIAEDELNMLINEGRRICEGEFREVFGQWAVRGVNIESRKPNVILDRNETVQHPRWWGRERRLTKQFFRSWVGCRDEVVPRPQIKIFVGVPIESYLNPVLRKANRNQQKRSVHVIAFDVSRLPGAFRELKEKLPCYFEQWDHVSGVLVYRTFMEVCYRSVGWYWYYFENQYALDRFAIEIDGASGEFNGPNQTFSFLRHGAELEYVGKQHIER